MPTLTTPEEGLILTLLFMLVEIDRRETAAALDQQQQQQNGQTSKKGQYHQLLKSHCQLPNGSPPSPPSAC